MIRVYKPSELRLRKGDLVEIDAKKDGRFVGYVSSHTERTICLRPSKPGRETGTDYDNTFMFWYANFRDSPITIIRLLDTPRTGLEKKIRLDISDID